MLALLQVLNCEVDLIVRTKTARVSDELIASRRPMTVKAIYENGVFRPLEPVHLAEHTEV